MNDVFRNNIGGIKMFVYTIDDIIFIISLGLFIIGLILFLIWCFIDDIIKKFKR